MEGVIVDTRRGEGGYWLRKRWRVKSGICLCSSSRVWLGGMEIAWLWRGRSSEEDTLRCGKRHVE